MLQCLFYLLSTHLPNKRVSLAQKFHWIPLYQYVNDAQHLFSVIVQLKMVKLGSRVVVEHSAGRGRAPMWWVQIQPNIMQASQTSLRAVCYFIQIHFFYGVGFNMVCLVSWYGRNGYSVAMDFILTFSD
jgi:hypothetical protein